MVTLTIRNPEFTDINDIRECNTATLPENYSIPMYYFFISRSSRLSYVARAPSGMLLGYVICNYVDESEEGSIRNTHHIVSLGVYEKYHGLGIGSILLKKVIESVRLDGGEFITLYVRKQTNVRAIRLYKRLGFTEKSEIEKYYGNGEDAIIMEYRIVTPESAS